MLAALRIERFVQIRTKIYKWGFKEIEREKNQTNSFLIHSFVVSLPIQLQVLNVSGSFVVPLPIFEPVSIDGCEVSLIYSNHCPGAVL
ncbi:putative DNA ligase (ATP) [Helianthus anomalus]